MPSGHEPNEKTSAQFNSHGIVGARLTAPRKPNWLWRKRNMWRNHMTATDLSQYIGQELFDQYTKISCIRNPFDRTVSLFNWKNRSHQHAYQSDKDMIAAFRDFVRAQKLMPDYDIVHVNGAFVPDLLVRFEHMREDLQRVANKVKFKFAPESMPHTKNLSSLRKGIHTADFFDSASVDIVRKELAWMFERGHYPDSPQAQNEIESDPLSALE